MNEHKERPVERVMNNAFARMKGLVSSDTVVGEPITTADGVSIVPITKVTMGFLTGGGEYSDMSRQNYDEYPFAGGSGAGVSVSPVGFLISDGKSIKIVTLDDKSAFEQVFEMIPEVIRGIFGKSDSDTVPKKTVDKAVKKLKKEISKK